MRRISAALALLLATATALAAPQLPQPLPGGVVIAATPRPIADFTLTDQDGKPWRFAALKGHPALVFFGFTHCPDICPTTLMSLRQLSQRDELATWRIVMVSVDGERDTPDVLRRYLARFSPQFIGLTGPASQVSGIAAQFPAVFFKGIAPAPGADYVVQHTAAVYAIDARGQVRAQFTDVPVETMLDVIRSVR